MRKDKKHQIAAILLIVLGVAILIIGLISTLAPPIITGVGFLVLAWALYPSKAAGATHEAAAEDASRPAS